MSLQRINKYLAHSSGISRREADELVAAGKVRINERIATLGSVVDPDKDAIAVESHPVAPRKRYTYLLVNKPIGYVCSRKQQGDSATVYALLPRRYHHLKVAGRLDKDSCGLVLLTDDGDTIFKITHPKFGKRKVYHVGLNKPLKPGHQIAITTGVELEDGASALQVEPLAKEKRPNLYKITMHEGRNRQIRRTFLSLGYTVTHLERTHLGGYSLDDLSGKRYLQI